MTRLTKLYASGKFVDPMNLYPCDIEIEDIAHNLAYSCRYGGSFPFHYSVAQHSALVCNELAKVKSSPMEMLTGLLHDAAEYLLSDLITQVKHHPIMHPYRMMEQHTLDMILKKFHCDPMFLPQVKPYEQLVYQMEQRARNHEENDIQELTPAEAKELFLNCFAALRPFVQRI